MSRVSVQKNPKVEGSAAHDAVATDNPLVMGGVAASALPAAVANLDMVRAHFDVNGHLHIVARHTGATRDGFTGTLGALMGDNSDTARALAVGPVAFAPDSAYDSLRSAMDAAPGLGALNVAPIGGDITLRASAIAGEAGGSSTAVDNLGWVKGFNCHLDVTAAPAGGAPTLDVYLQTQLASGDWQDIVHFTQATGATAEIVDWGPGDGNFSGIGAEGSAMTYDRFFAEQDGALTAVNVRMMNLGDSMRVKWAFAAGGSTGDFTFAVTGTFHS